MLQDARSMMSANKSAGADTDEGQLNLPAQFALHLELCAAAAVIHSNPDRSLLAGGCPVIVSSFLHPFNPPTHILTAPLPIILTGCLRPFSWFRTSHGASRPAQTQQSLPHAPRGFRRAAGDERMENNAR